MYQLNKKVALVTGGSRGIGAAIAKRLAKEGASVAITYTSSPEKAEAVVKEMKALGVKAASFQADQSDPKQIETMVNAVVKQFGHLDILVNNAGILATGTIDDPKRDANAMKKLMEINVQGVAHTVRAAVKHLKDGARIITIGSAVGERMPFSGMADYTATKAALIGYTKGWARDLGHKNITVNLVEPGPIETDMTKSEGGLSADELTSALAIPRFGKPEEIAAVAAFLASNESSYMTGSLVTVDGGFSA